MPLDAPVINMVRGSFMRFAVQPPCCSDVSRAIKPNRRSEGSIEARVSADILQTANAVASMTGFARTEGGIEGYDWTFEIKSVNGRNLDIRCRLPGGLDQIEVAARAEIPRRIRRGNVTVTVTLNRAAPTAQLRVNRDLLDHLFDLARELQASGAEPPRVDGLLSIRGVIEAAEEVESPDFRRHLENALTVTLGEAVDRLAEVRLAEGARLLQILHNQLDEIAALTERAARCASLQPMAIKERLRTQVNALLDAVPTLSEERLAQEAALLIVKGDVREELDRLNAHIAAARDLLGEGGAIGRRFDFLCQEFNREANTLCSKSTDVELTTIGLALKATIEQMREQVQNIE